MCLVAKWGGCATLNENVIQPEEDYVGTETLNDTEKGAALGGLGGAAIGAIAGAAAGPVGALVGALAGGLAGAGASGAVVNVLEHIEHSDDTQTHAKQPELEADEQIS